MLKYEILRVTIYEMHEGRGYEPLIRVEKIFFKKLLQMFGV